MPRSLYYPYMHRRLEHTLTRAVVRIAYPDAWEEDGKVYSGNTRHILGFILAEPSQDNSVGLILHYLYTRRDYAPNGTGGVQACYRRQGIAKALLESMMRDYKMDHITFTIWGQELVRSDSLFDRLVNEWFRDMTYNPELFNTLLPPHWERGVAAAPNSNYAKAFWDQKAHSPTDF